MFVTKLHSIYCKIPHRMCCSRWMCQIQPVDTGTAYDGRMVDGCSTVVGLRHQRGWFRTRNSGVTHSDVLLRWWSSLRHFGIATYSSTKCATHNPTESVNSPKFCVRWCQQRNFRVFWNEWMTPHHKLPVPVFHLFDSIGRRRLSTSHRFRCFIRYIDFLFYYPFDIHTYIQLF